MGKRAPNFCFAETEALIFNLEIRSELIANNASGSGLDREQREAWEEVAKSVTNASSANPRCVSGVKRSALEVKRKWHDMKSRIKCKAEQIAKHKLENGDDNPCPLTLSCLEERVLALIRSACPPGNVSNLGENSVPVLDENLILARDGFRDEVEDEQDQCTCYKKRRLEDSDEIVLKNILEMQSQIKEAHLQQIEEIKKMKEMFHRIVKLKEAKLKLKCIKYGLNYKAVLD